MTIPYLYDEDGVMIWNVSANGTNPGAVYTDYSDYPTAWFSGVTCSKTDSTANCYMNTTSDYFWLKISHFSNIQSKIAGLAPATTTTTSPPGYSSATTTTTAPTTTTTTTIPEEETETVDLVAAGETATFEFETTALRIESVAIVANKALADITVTVKESSLPTDASAPIESDIGIMYKYLELTKSEFTNDDITTATIKFKIEKTWITSNSIDEDKVYLYRYANNTWEKLTTTKLSSDANYIYYEAESTGLSVFAIGGEKLPTTTTTLPAGLPFELGTLEIIAIIIVIALIIVFVLYKKRIIVF